MNTLLQDFMARLKLLGVKVCIERNGIYHASGVTNANILKKLIFSKCTILTPPQFGPYSRYSSDGTKLEGLEDPSLNG